jgi:hypothetical protein
VIEDTGAAVAPALAGGVGAGAFLEIYIQRTFFHVSLSNSLIPAKDFHIES